MRKQINMVFDYETKGAVRYTEVDAAGDMVDRYAGVVGTLYIRKSALSGDIPKKLTVTIEG